MRTLKNMVGVALLLLFVSCIRSDYDTDLCPGYCTITPLVPVEMQTSGREHLPGTETKVSYRGSEWRETEVGPDCQLNLTKGNYAAVSLKDANENITSDGTIVTVKANPDDTSADPGEFVGGYIDFEVEEVSRDYEVINYDLPTFVQTRMLMIRVKVEGSNAALLETVTGRVNGVSLSRDLHHAFIEDAGQDRYPALKTGKVDYSMNGKDDEGYYTDSHWLLGLDGDENQLITLTLNYAGDITKSFSFDVTEGLDGFHTDDILEPWVITIILRAGSDFTATIEDWYAGPEEWLDAKPEN